RRIVRDRYGRFGPRLATRPVDEPGQPLEDLALGAWVHGGRMIDDPSGSDRVVHAGERVGGAVLDAERLGRAARADEHGAGWVRAATAGAAALVVDAERLGRAAGAGEHVVEAAAHREPGVAPRERRPHVLGIAAHREPGTRAQGQTGAAAGERLPH